MAVSQAKLKENKLINLHMLCSYFQISLDLYRQNGSKKKVGHPLTHLAVKPILCSLVTGLLTSLQSGQTRTNKYERSTAHFSSHQLYFSHSLSSLV